MSTAPFRKYPVFMQKYLKQTIGSNRLYLAISVMEKTPVANSEERLHCDSRDTRAVPGGSHRQLQPGDCPVGVGGDSRAPDEAQSDYGPGTEGFVRCDGAGRCGRGKVAGSEITAWAAWASSPPAAETGQVAARVFGFRTPDPVPSRRRHPVGMPRCRIVDRKNRHRRRLGRPAPRQLCCAFLAIRYMKPDRPALPPLARRRVASRKLSTMATTA